MTVFFTLAGLWYADMSKNIIITAGARSQESYNLEQKILK